MIPIHQETELAVRLPGNTLGSDQLCALLSERGIHVKALSCFYDRTGCVALVVTEEPAEATEVLEEAGFSWRGDQALLVGPSPSRPGMLVELGRELRRAGVGILSSHLCPTDNDTMLAVLHTTDDKTALRILNQAGVC